MDTDSRNFWLAALTGVIVMLGFALVFVNIFDFVPFIGPFVGGLAAGLVARKGLLYGGKAGLVSGMAAGLFVSLDYLIGTGFLTGASIQIATATVSVFIIMSIIYFAILAFIGGAFGGWIRR